MSFWFTYFWDKQDKITLSLSFESIEQIAVSLLSLIIISIEKIESEGIVDFLTAFILKENLALLVCSL